MKPAISVFNAKEAIKLYQEVFGVTVVDDIYYMNSIPGYEDDKYKDLIAHSELLFGENKIYVNDILEEHPQTIGDHVQFCLYFESIEELKDITDKLKKHGEVKRYVEKEHWGAHSSVVLDKFGVTWNLYYLIEHIENKKSQWR